ncbi:hypothetical protein ROZALSC1DRAFT_20836 [Rozella allomycis CSF55]|uniref:Uncharacterized protein n=1 Tax=Rozella allomycis (strain CSF55) TaxID=988480 RepID=A0A4P9YNB4_ROZAC|nr:hypothetical protein ROZALSC1DRAFT_20836 [Rozella allomycis CSF55]
MSTIIRIYNAVGAPLEQLFCQKLRFSVVGHSPHAPKIPDFQQLLIMAIIFLFNYFERQTSCILVLANGLSEHNLLRYSKARLFDWGGAFHLEALQLKVGSKNDRSLYQVSRSNLEVDSHGKPLLDLSLISILDEHIGTRRCWCDRFSEIYTSARIARCKKQ